MSAAVDTQSILKIVQFIQNSTVENKEEVLGLKYKNFKKQYPVLFEVACRNEKIDLNMLQMMLSMKDRIKNNEISQYDASAGVGQVLYDKYVDPLVKKNEAAKSSETSPIDPLSWHSNPPLDQSPDIGTQT